MAKAKTKDPISATIDKSVNEAVKRMAKAENRYYSNMLEVLLREAINKRGNV